MFFHFQKEKVAMMRMNPGTLPLSCGIRSVPRAHHTNPTERDTVKSLGYKVCCSPLPQPLHAALEGTIIVAFKAYFVK